MPPCARIVGVSAMIAGVAAAARRRGRAARIVGQRRACGGRRHAFEQRDIDVLRQVGTRSHGGAVRGIALLADLDHVGRGRQTQSLLRRAFRHAVDEEFGAARSRAHDHVAEDRCEGQLDDLACARADADLARGARVTVAAHGDRLRHIRTHGDVERSTTAIDTADRDVRARRRAAHDELSVRHAELDRADRERCVGLDLDVALPRLETLALQLEPVVAAHELGRERRHALRLTRDQNLCAGGLARDRDSGPAGHELWRQRLAFAETLDRDVRGEILVTLGIDRERVLARGQLDLAGHLGRLAGTWLASLLATLSVPATGSSMRSRPGSGWSCTVRCRDPARVTVTGLRNVA